MERREDLRFLRGRGNYVDDLAPANLLHAVILRSSVAHGRIASIDASRRADDRRACTRVITAKDMPGGPPIIPMRLQPLPEFKPFEQPVIAHDKVRYVGEPIAVVLARASPSARTRWTHIAVDIEPLPPVADRHAAARDKSAAVRGGGHQPLADVPRRARAMPTRRSRRRPTCRRETLPHPAPLRRCTMEPRGVMAEWDAAQGPAHRLGRGQGAVLQPPHPGEA